MFTNFLISLLITGLVGWGAFPPGGGIIHLLLVVSVASFVLHHVGVLRAFPRKRPHF
jgi:formate hydrogenlyase subunit 4